MKARVTMMTAIMAKTAIKMAAHQTIPRDIATPAVGVGGMPTTSILQSVHRSGLLLTYTLISMTRQALEMLVAHGLDAMNIDLKGEAEAVRRFCGADVNVVWRNAAWAKQHRVWVELTTLVIPNVNDAEDGLQRMARRIKRELGDDIPWHLTGYYPAYKFRDDFYVPPTPLSTLEKARDIGIAEGLKFVYVGNVPGHPYENTYCLGCQQSLIERYSFSLTRYNISSDKHCPYCGQDIPIIGEPCLPNREG